MVELLASVFQSLIAVALSNVVVALIIACGAGFAGWRLRHPAVAHALWILVLVKLITPPLFPVSIPVPLIAISQANESVDLVGIQTARLAAITSEQEASMADKDLVVSGVKASTLGSIPAVKDTKLMTQFALRNWFVLSIWAIGLIWIAVSATLLFSALARTARFWRILRDDGTGCDEASAMIEEIAEVFCLKTVPQVRLINASLSPMLFGFGKNASVVLPKKLWDELNPTQRRAMIAHELAHYRRRDHWTRGLELVVSCIYFWLPLVKLARTQIERMEETACDCQAVEVLQDKRGYAESLLFVVDHISLRGGRIPSMASGMQPSLTLEERLVRIMNEQTCGMQIGQHRAWVAAIMIIAIAIHPILSAAAYSGASKSMRNVTYGTIDVIGSSASNAKSHHEAFLPDSPKGWWTNHAYESAVREVEINASGCHSVRFNPGVAIEIVDANLVATAIAEASPTAMVLLREGKRIIVGNRRGEIRVWDTEAMESVSFIGRHDHSITSLCYHPQFGLLSSDERGLIMQWEMESGAILNSWTLDAEPVQSLRSNSDGTQLFAVTSVWNQSSTTSRLHILKTDSWSAICRLELPVPIATVVERSGIAYALDWSGKEYLLPLTIPVGEIPKSDVSALVFSQDAIAPETDRFSLPARSVTQTWYSLLGGWANASEP